MGKKIFIRCELCGKRLIERMPNGLWSFSFGRPGIDKKSGTPLDTIVPVRIVIHGSIKMKCIRKSCRLANPDHWNILNFFPANQSDKEVSAIGTTESSGINDKKEILE